MGKHLGARPNLKRRFDMVILTHKLCTRCGESKPVSEFYKRERGYLRSHCKACTSIRSHQYFVDHIEEFDKRSRQWVAENKDAARSIYKKYYDTHKDISRAKARERYKANPFKCSKWHREHEKEHKELIRQWDATHREEKREHYRKYRARKMDAPGNGVTKEEWESILLEYENQCIGPGPHRGELAMDHVVPLSKGGADDISNVQPLCRTCNSRKGTKMIDYR